MQIMLDTWEAHAMAIYALSWVVLRAREGELVLGDRVVTMRDPTPRFPWSGNGWHSSQTAYATVPLSPELCLRLNQPGERPIAERETSAQIDRINLRSYGWADSYVYGRSRAVIETLHAAALADPDALERRRPSPQVVMEEADPDDPSVGKEHPPGYPRGLWIDPPDMNGGPKFVSYELIWEDEADRPDTAAPP